MPGRGKGGGGGGAVSGGVKSMLNTAGKRVRDLDVPDAAPPAKRPKPGTKASGVSGGKKPQKLWATPMVDRRTEGARTVPTVSPRPATNPADTPDASWSEPRVAATNWDRQTTYWAARWLPTSKNPKGLGGGDVPTTVHGQAAWVAYQRADRVLYPRQSFPKDVRHETWERVVGSSNTYTDVGGRTITRDGTWDMGHNPGHEHWSNVRDAVADGVHPTDFKNDYLDPGNYRPEHPSTNRTHEHEAD